MREKLFSTLYADLPEGSTRQMKSTQTQLRLRISELDVTIILPLLKLYQTWCLQTNTPVILLHDANIHLTDEGQEGLVNTLSTLRA